MQEVTLFSLFLIGLSFGSTACMFSCIPFLSPLLISNSKDYKQTFELLVPFSLGRVFTYITIALIASTSAIWIKEIINNPTISQTILGVATIVVALLIFKNSFSKKSSCCSTSTNTPKNKIGYFFMGAGISINPCVPVLTLVTASTHTTSFIEAFGFGLVFGFGAIIASFLVFGLILSKVAKEIMVEFNNYKTAIERFAAFLLFLVGTFTLNGMLAL